MAFGETQRRVEAAMKSAQDIMQRDLRVRMLVDSSVAAAKDKMGRYIDPEHADEEAFRLAQMACALLAARIYDEDAEIATLRMERDHYRKLAEDTLALTPRAPFLLETKPNPATPPASS